MTTFSLLLLLCCCCCCCCSSSCCSSSLARAFLFGPGQRYLPFLDALCHFLFWDCCCSKNSLFWFVWDKFATFLFLCCHAFLLVSAPRRPSSLPQLSQLLLLLLFSLSLLCASCLVQSQREVQCVDTKAEETSALILGRCFTPFKMGGADPPTFVWENRGFFAVSHRESLPGSGQGKLGGKARPAMRGVLVFVR